MLRGVCKYREIAWFGDPEYWECSECQYAWVINTGTPFENGMKFCPSCGARITEEVPYKYEEE